eukprot:m.187198 g.187198  ORF g.187198 m.187198 type:complete len:91 (+) comp14772_c0_seq1:387-659(+)
MQREFFIKLSQCSLDHELKSTETRSVSSPPAHKNRLTLHRPKPTPQPQKKAIQSHSSPSSACPRSSTVVARDEVIEELSDDPSGDGGLRV